MTYLQTGDNPNKGYELLKGISVDLERKRGCTILPPVIDGTKKPCALHIRQGNQHAYVVARGTTEYKDHIVSTQQFLIKKAINNGVPIIMWSNGHYWLFDPEYIQMKNEGPNDRFGEVMINFSINQARIWDTQPLESLWVQVKAQTQVHARSKLTMFLKEA